MVAHGARILAIATGGPIGAAAATATAYVLNVDPVLGYAVLGATATVATSALLAPAIAARRPRATATLAASIYAVGVVLFPLASVVLGLEVPAGGQPLRPDELPAAYALTPLAAMAAFAFLPGVAVTAVVAAGLTRSVAPAGIAIEATPTEADERFRRRSVRFLRVVGAWLALGGVVFAAIAAASPFGY
jgi:hypothetical protein